MVQRRPAQPAVADIVRRLSPRARRAFQARMLSRAKTAGKRIRSGFDRLSILQRSHLEALVFHTSEVYSSAIDAVNVIDRITVAKNRTDILELLVSLEWEIRNLQDHSTALNGLLARAIRKVSTTIKGRNGEKSSRAAVARVRAIGDIVRNKLFPDLMHDLGADETILGKPKRASRVRRQS